MTMTTTIHKKIIIHDLYGPNEWKTENKTKKKHEKVDFIFSTFIFVVTRLMKHINFVAAMTRDVFFSSSRSHTHSHTLSLVPCRIRVRSLCWNRCHCLFIYFSALVRFFFSLDYLTDNSVSASGFYVNDSRGQVWMKKKT